MKYAENGQFDVACKGALKHIEEKKYETKLKEDGMNTIVFGGERRKKPEVYCYLECMSVRKFYLPALTLPSLTA